MLLRRSLSPNASLINSRQGVLRGTQITPGRFSSWGTQQSASLDMAASQSGRDRPPWASPKPADPDSGLPPLRIWNSLTKEKNAFVPRDWKNRKVSLYACGITPYSNTHLGHIRNYGTLDIIVRILKDYFGFDVNFVMNVTDVDDKIILRARQRHLLAEYKAKCLDENVGAPSEENKKVDAEALQAYINKNLGEYWDTRKSAEQIYNAVAQELSNIKELRDEHAKKRMHAETALGASRALKAKQDGAALSSEDEANLDDVLMPYLDSKAVSRLYDNALFQRFARKYEDLFWEDLRMMNCLPVSAITRVTEYIPQIVKFVSKIESNGYAYQVSDGSVYFDIGAFERDGNSYPRLEPSSRNDMALRADGEGALTKQTSEKRDPSDFALWKASKAGEPSWASPWGRGRPGWHIECSAMASDKLGSRFDIHSGGIDLKFPHHDNELAQSEAYWTTKEAGHQHQWVNYFVHLGHLSISGAKMSKSLKNFITIREAFSRGDYTPRGLRIIFLLGSWKEGVEIKPGLIQQQSAWEDKVNNFFMKARDTAEKQDPATMHGSRNDPLVDALDKAKKTTDDALCDSFNTAQVMEAIESLITTINTTDAPDASSVLNAAKWVTKIVTIFGLNGDATPGDGSIGWSGMDIPEASRPIVSALSIFRDRLRTVAKSSLETSTELSEDTLRPILQDPTHTSDLGAEAPAELAKILSNFRKDVENVRFEKGTSKEILQLCDRVRDIDLWEHGIALEDRLPEPALIRPVTRELREKKEKERAEKEAREQGKLAKEQLKAQAQLEREREAAARAEKGRLSHVEMFKTEEYSAWDDNGIPTKDKDGGELPKNRVKKLGKDWERQKKLHEAWLRSNGG